MPKRTRDLSNSRATKYRMLSNAKRVEVVESSEESDQSSSLATDSYDSYQDVNGDDVLDELLTEFGLDSETDEAEESNSLNWDQGSDKNGIIGM